MYIQDKVAEYADEVFNRMDNGAHMYFCGLKGMMPGILEMLEKVAYPFLPPFPNSYSNNASHSGGVGQRPNVGGEAQGVEGQRPMARRSVLKVIRSP